MDLITEFEFELPRGYLDENGELHKKGVMRMATAADEILPLRDPRVVSNPGVSDDHSAVEGDHFPWNFDQHPADSY